jgi:hypothetical protein
MTTEITASLNETTLGPLKIASPTLSEEKAVSMEMDSSQGESDKSTLVIASEDETKKEVINVVVETHDDVVKPEAVAGDAPKDVTETIAGDTPEETEAVKATPPPAELAPFPLVTVNSFQSLAAPPSKKDPYPFKRSLSVEGRKVKKTSSRKVDPSKPPAAAIPLLRRLSFRRKKETKKDSDASATKDDMPMKSTTEGTPISTGEEATANSVVTKPMTQYAPKPPLPKPKGRMVNASTPKVSGEEIETVLKSENTDNQSVQSVGSTALVTSSSEEIETVLMSESRDTHSVQSVGSTDLMTTSSKISAAEIETVLKSESKDNHPVKSGDPAGFLRTVKSDVGGMPESDAISLRRVQSYMGKGAKNTPEGGSKPLPPSLDDIDTTDVTGKDTVPSLEPEAIETDEVTTHDTVSSSKPEEEKKEENDTVSTKGATTGNVVDEVIGKSNIVAPATDQAVKVQEDNEKKTLLVDELVLPDNSILDSHQMPSGEQSPSAGSKNQLGADPTCASIHIDACTSEVEIVSRKIRTIEKACCDALSTIDPR